MQIGMIGLGRMGGNMTRRLLKGGHDVVAFDPDRKARDAVAAAGAVPAESIELVVEKLAVPRAAWVMVPSGDPTEATINELGKRLSPGDVVVDGGNSFYRESMRRAADLLKKGIFMLDAGTSGGIWGLENGYCLMIGGDSDAFRRLEPIFQTLAPAASGGYGHVGPSGAGHFVKMVHNAIEYGLMEAYAEGLELMQAKQEFDLDLHRVTEIWRHGSVVRSWLLDLTAKALDEDPKLGDIQAYVEDSGEGRWAIAEANDLAVPVPAIALSLQMRFRSRQPGPFRDKLLAALRQQFGGHAVREVQ